MIKWSGVGFFFLVSMVTAALRDFPQETKPKRKERTGKEKGQRRLRKRLGRCWGVRYFLLRGQSLVRFSASTVLITRSQGVNTNLYTVCVIVSHSFSTLLCWCVFSSQGGILLPCETHPKVRWISMTPGRSGCSSLSFVTN